MSAFTPNLDDLRAFVAVAHRQSFRKAALDLGVTPSALSHTLRGLESRLAVRLLHRTTRSVAPTEAGQLLLDRLTPALTDIEQALAGIDDYRQSLVGTLRINAPRAAVDLVLGARVRRFLDAHPGMQVELISDNAMIDIVAAGFDAGVRFGRSLQRDMVSIPFGEPQRFVTVGAPSLLKARALPRHPTELLNWPCIRQRFPSGTVYRWEFQRGEERLDVEVQGRVTCNDMREMIKMAEHGLGLAYVYEAYALQALSEGRLEAVLSDWYPPAESFHLYFPDRSLMPSGMRAWVEMLKNDIASMQHMAGKTL